MSERSYQERIEACCRELKLASSLAERAMTTEGQTHQEFLYRLFSEEVECRRQRRIDKYIGEAGFPRRYIFSQFRDDEVEFQTDCSVKQLESLDFLKEGRNVIMYGGTGTGKTMLSICIGMRLCQNSIPVKFFRTAALVNQLSEHKAAGTLTPFLKKLNRASVLILDEFGYVPYDRMGAQLLFDYLSEIHEQKQIILNTNLEFSRWVNILYDEQMTSALIGRLTHHCHLILFPGENNRLKESSLNETYRRIAEKHGQEDLYND